MWSQGPSDLSDARPLSGEVAEGLVGAVSRDRLGMAGPTRSDLGKPLVGVASSWNEITPGNLGLDWLAQAAKDGVHAAGGYPIEFGTISLSGSVPLIHEGLQYSLVSREIIADSVETVIKAERLDGSVLLAGRDTSLPGMLMAAARLDLASVLLYAGTAALPDLDSQRQVTDADAFEAMGVRTRGLMSRQDVDAIEQACHPGGDACAGMYAANTMASVAEALGMSVPGSTTPPAADRRRRGYARRSGVAVMELLRRGITARDVLTHDAFENAISVVMALGGSTNAVLHLLAIAHEAEVQLGLSDFGRISARVPQLADVEPFGRHGMIDIDRVGGIPVVMKVLLDAGFLHGDALTVTGRTLADNLAAIDPPDPDGMVLRPLDTPTHRTGGLNVLHGSLAPGGAIGMSARFGVVNFTGTARVFGGERAAIEALTDGAITRGDVVVIPYEGPKGGPGMPEMLAITGAIKGAGLGRDVLLVTDGRFCGGAAGLYVAHVSPEAAEGGPIGLVYDGDKIRLDLQAGTVDLLVDEGELALRESTWAAGSPRATRGVLGKYARTVVSASNGAVCM